MQLLVLILAFVLPVVFGAVRADAASCSSFAKIVSYDAAAKSAQVSFEKGNERKFFPKPEGSTSTSKLPKNCSGKVKKQEGFPVKPTGGRMSVTQVRANFSGKMINDTSDDAWLPAQLKKLIEEKTEVVIVLRPPPGKKEPFDLTTIYLPITEEEIAEIKRIDENAQDM